MLEVSEEMAKIDVEQLPVRLNHDVVVMSISDTLDKRKYFRAYLIPIERISYQNVGSH